MQFKFNLDIVNCDINILKGYKINGKEKSESHTQAKAKKLIPENHPKLFW